ncbi:MAG: dephospho-CoA kinase [Mycoplasmataceae bacterium]|nr:dephospho-CoA kinase [Mycoplasmataceae bacterium]
MIAIIGKTCVGKTFLLEKAKEFGYSTLNCDEFFQKQYKFGNDCYKIIKKSLGEKYVNEVEVDRNMIKKLILTKNGRNNLEKLIFPVLFEHFKKFKYDFVEIPILYSKNGNFKPFFNKILNIVASSETRKKILKFKNVDKYDFEFYDSLNNGICEEKCVDINMDNICADSDWEFFFKSHYIKII